MSEWHHIKSSDIMFDKGRKEVDVYVKSDDRGRVYASFTFDQIERIYNDIKSLEQDNESSPAGQ